jgi:hypothetical protein
MAGDIFMAIEAAIAEGKFSSLQRDALFTMARDNPAAVRALIAATPAVTLSDIELDVARAMGMSPAKVLESKKRAIAEGRFPFRTRPEDEPYYDDPRVRFLKPDEPYYDDPATRLKKTRDPSY